MNKNLKIISLNAWCGRVGDKLIEFFKDNEDVDIFCLQEIFHNGSFEMKKMVYNTDPRDNYELLKNISDALPNHIAYFRPQIDDYFGLALFIKKDIHVLEENEVFVHKEKGYDVGEYFGLQARNIQYVTIELNSSKITIANFHGLWNGQGKTDSEDRIIQSQNISSFIKNQKNSVLLCGDFNLLPDTESIKIIEDTGLKNLIKENNIISTRTSLYTKLEKFADYVFVSKGIQVEEFKVLPDVVSDHAAMSIILSV